MSQVIREIRSALNERVYSGTYQLEYDADEFERCIAALENNIHRLTESAVWEYVSETVSGWMPRPTSAMLEYNTPRYNARELFCLTVLSLWAAKE